MVPMGNMGNMGRSSDLRFIKSDTFDPLLTFLAKPTKACAAKHSEDVCCWSATAYRCDVDCSMNDFFQRFRA